jgi:high frequency lysogenization protein
MNKSNKSQQSEYVDKTIALAGMFQACSLIKELAWSNKCNEQDFTTSIHSLLKVTSSSTIDIYGSLESLATGLKTLITFLNKNPKKDVEIARYVFSLLYLENKLKKRADLMEIIKYGIKRASNQAKLFSVTHENVIANLANIYVDTLSTFTFRIQVSGSKLFLTNPYNVNKTRALLLAGIRSAVLWRQLGGSRLQLFFKKNSFLKYAQSLNKTLVTT